MMVEKEYVTVADTAKLIRQVLKKAFPGVKFSVRSKSYSGGASVRVNWVDGPRIKEVEPVVSRFEGATFDGMIDLKEYKDELVVTSDGNLKKVHYGADFVFCSRSYSVPFFTEKARIVAERYSVDMPEILISDYNGSPYLATDSIIPNIGERFGTMIYREAEKEA